MYRFHSGQITVYMYLLLKYIHIYMWMYAHWAQQNREKQKRFYIILDILALSVLKIINCSSHSSICWGLSLFQKLLLGAQSKMPQRQAAAQFPAKQSHSAKQHLTAASAGGTKIHGLGWCSDESWGWILKKKIRRVTPHSSTLCKSKVNLTW